MYVLFFTANELHQVYYNDVLSSDDNNVFLRLADFKMMGKPVFFPPKMLFTLLITKC